ncbi:DNA repair protein RecN [Saccharibacillus sp. JS10]|uniref:DNA repair protein RecN n=1 Tax=Saccharibacillus sp. JS10 TaxID=2950552 RepID=UPI00210BA9E2|nr:DNA repair protein RecN [Saccharibacillus sp. JS10]MCQ4085877.1 DNA repair protein RecN [Saccharibacillus sp. JS10]
MLVALSIRNLAVVEAVDVHFYHGFHVLSGETGAGKSIIIDALGLISGGRSSSDLIRYGADKAEMEALFELQDEHPVWKTLEQLGISASSEEHLVIRREVNTQGKSTSRINGQLVNLTMLREVGEQLINIHGQHEHQSLLRPESHLGLLDAYGGDTIAPAKAAYQQEYSTLAKLERELKDLRETSQKSLQMLDMYRFQLEEIEAAKLKVGEDVELADERSKLAYSEKLMESVSEGYDSLYGERGIASINSAISSLEDVENYDAKAMQPILEQLRSAFYQLEDAAFQLRDYRENIEFNPGRLEEVEDRLNLLSGLRRKYGDSVEQILEYYNRIHRETDMLENKDERLDLLTSKRDKQLEKTLVLARELSTLRRECSRELARQIEGELKDLQMQRTSIEVRLEPIQDARGFEFEGRRVRLTRQGVDSAEFLISPNPGEPLRPLGKIASGGELSRIMLALKSIFARHDKVPVLIFDEVDTGVSGRAAQSIAEKLVKLSRDCQVFSITHLPQVACMSDHQYLIEKRVEGERTMTRVESLNEQGRVTELARMLGGVEITEKTLHHAQEMLKLAEESKSQHAS